MEYIYFEADLKAVLNLYGQTIRPTDPDIEVSHREPFLDIKKGIVVYKLSGHKIIRPKKDKKKTNQDKKDEVTKDKVDSEDNGKDPKNQDIKMVKPPVENKKGDKDSKKK